jgi:urease accessory protein
MPAAIAMPGPMMTDPASTLRMLAWLSPAFPTGGYAYSHGLEWVVEAREITDAATLQPWITAILTRGAGRNDAILLRHAHAAQGDLPRLAELCELALAVTGARERRAETVGQGAGFIAAARAWNATLLPALAARVGDVPYPIAVGALSGVAGLDVEMIVLGVLQAFAANLISAAVRLVPLGQSTGLAVLAALEPTLIETAAATRGLDLDDLGGFTPRMDLAAMRHETQYTRLFRS